MKCMKQTGIAQTRMLSLPALFARVMSILLAVYHKQYLFLDSFTNNEASHCSFEERSSDATHQVAPNCVTMIDECVKGRV